MTKLQSSSRRLLRLKDAAVYVSLSPWKLRKLVQDGQLPIDRAGVNSWQIADMVVRARGIAAFEEFAGDRMRTVTTGCYVRWLRHIEHSELA
jgi:hypothetical protein